MNWICYLPVAAVSTARVAETAAASSEYEAMESPCDSAILTLSVQLLEKCHQRHYYECDNYISVTENKTCHWQSSSFMLFYYEIHCSQQKSIEKWEIRPPHIKNPWTDRPLNCIGDYVRPLPLCKISSNYPLLPPIMRKCASSDSASFFSERGSRRYMSSAVRLSSICRLSVCL